MPIPEEVITSIGVNDVKAQDTVSNTTYNVTGAETAGHQARLNRFAEQFVGGMGALMLATTASVVKAVNESDLGEEILQSGSALGSQQMAAKTAQTAPPVTAGPVAGTV